ncbi:MAG: esterase/lipase family protein [Solirubrobacterales bacterium]
MRALALSERRAGGELAAELAVDTCGLVQRTHTAIADRVLGLTGTRRTPIGLLHNSISRLSYGSVELGLRAAGQLAGVAIGASGRAAREPTPISETPAGAIGMAVVTGWGGDRLAAEGSPLAAGMSLRRDERAVEVTLTGLRAAYPEASSRLAFFVHGLMESEHVWWLGTRRRDGTRAANYGEKLQADLGYTPVYVRYNSGLHVSENGRELARLIERTVAAWPTEVREITIFGHSMGGLIARSANHYAEVEGADYVDRVRHVICSGSPHHGSPLELFANWGAKTLGMLPESRGFQAMVDSRSAGVKDMRYGNVTDEDWQGHDPNELWRDRRKRIPMLASANHYFISASLTRNPKNPISRVLGDILVTGPSAWAESLHNSGARYDVDRSINIGGTTHFHLTSHPGIYQQVKRWLMPKQLPAQT